MAQINRTLGGNRLGAGRGMSIGMHGYGKSNHDLGYVTKFDACPGALIPFMIEPTLIGESASTVLKHLIRTLPTNGPAFISYKVQMDLFWVPIRLYNAQLHNVRLDIGINLDQVLFPQIVLRGPVPDPEMVNPNTSQIHPSSLMHYLGISGLGRPNDETATETVAKFQAMTMLAYADIYKNYYANKQEGTGRVIGSTGAEGEAVGDSGSFSTSSGVLQNYLTPRQTPLNGGTFTIGGANITATPEAGGATALSSTFPNDTALRTSVMHWEVSGTRRTELRLLGENMDITQCLIFASAAGESAATWRTIPDYIAATAGKFGEMEVLINNPREIRIAPKIGVNNAAAGIGMFNDNGTGTGATGATHPYRCVMIQGTGTIREIDIIEFDLKNIDAMRDTVLQQSIGQALLIGPGTSTRAQPAADEGTGEWLEPYATMVGTMTDKYKNSNYLNGLLLKTYQNDRFNTWLDTEWIDGPGGISAITAIDTSEGSFTQDTLLLAQKLYNNLNRIAAAGGTYVDYLEAAYGQRVHRMTEIPEFRGSASAEIVFEEVISSAAATQDGEGQPLGSLAGRGNTMNDRGGRISITADEHGFIMGIFSITPRLDYSQGNRWFNRWKTLRDLHMPEFDGLGYQELITDEFYAADTERDEDGNPLDITGDSGYRSIGKQPAFQEYRTNVNMVHGSFAYGEPLDWMVLDRAYEHDGITGELNDATTYVDPRKFSRNFASSELPDTTWAWVQIGVDTRMRRIMSNRIIPNL